MLKESDIDIPEWKLMNLFAIVHPKKKKELDIDEFIKFAFDRTAHKSKIIIKFVKLYRIS